DLLEQARALERRHAAPFLVSALCGRDRKVDIFRRGVGEVPERLRRTGIDRIEISASLWLVPLAVVVVAALGRQLELDGGQRIRRNRGVHRRAGRMRASTTATPPFSTTRIASLSASSSSDALFAGPNPSAPC